VNREEEGAFLLFLGMAESCALLASLLIWGPSVAGEVLMVYALQFLWLAVAVRRRKS
jgi:hypothetical protein